MYFRSQWEEVSYIKQQFYTIPEAGKRQIFEQVLRRDSPKQTEISQLERLAAGLLYSQVIPALPNR
jgi:hypothetical protein